MNKKGAGALFVVAMLSFATATDSSSSSTMSITGTRNLRADQRPPYDSAKSILRNLQDDTTQLDQDNYFVIGLRLQKLLGNFKQYWGGFFRPWFSFWNGDQKELPISSESLPGLPWTSIPTFVPTSVPNEMPTSVLSTTPSVAPTTIPSDTPSMVPSDMPSDAPSMVPTAGEGGGVLVGVVARNSNSHGDNTPIIAAASIIGAGLLFALLFFRKTKRAVMSESQYMKHKTFLSEFVGTGDHPNSYHAGAYHYTQNDHRYLSTRCEPCDITRRRLLGMSNSDSIDEESILGLISPNSKDIGKSCMCQDVHRCTSATCERCRMEERMKVDFVPAPNKAKTLIRPTVMWYEESA